MSEPIVFISHHRIKEGMLDEFRESYRKNTPLIQADKPGTVGFLHYLDGDESEVTSIHVFPDAQAMEHHMQGASERAGKAFQFLVPGRFEIFGKPNEKVLEFIKQVASDSGASLTVKPEYVAGYLRLKSG
jgi:quinol monooxygenase YgiN